MNEPTDTRIEQRSDRGPGRRMTWWRRMLFAVGAPAAAFLLRLVWSTFRYEVRGEEKILERMERGEPLIFGFWHETLLALTWYMARVKRRGVNITFLISPSVDGEFVAQVLARFKSIAIRGSATRSGAAALRGLKRAITKEHASPGITLDGPKGPHRYCKPGAIMTARMTGAPIVPMAVAASRSWRVKSWDRHLVPRPLSKVVLAIGDPYTVPRDITSDDVEDYRRDLEERVNQLSEWAGQQAEKPTEN